MAHDVIVIGAGAAGMAAASVAAADGLRVLLLEKSEKVGGTTAISGGMVWIPANAKMAAAGLADSPRRPRPISRRPSARSMRRSSGPSSRGRTRRSTISRRAPRSRCGPSRPIPTTTRSCPGRPPAGACSSRCPSTRAARARASGSCAEPLPEFTLFGGMMLDRADIPHFRNAFRSARSARRVLRLLSRYAPRARAPRRAAPRSISAMRLPGGCCTRCCAATSSSSPTRGRKRSMIEDGRVVGVTVLSDGGITAPRGGTRRRARDGRLRS